jgi:hypothetical protein
MIYLAINVQHKIDCIVPTTNIRVDRVARIAGPIE